MSLDVPTRKVRIGAEVFTINAADFDPVIHADLEALRKNGRFVKAEPKIEDAEAAGDVKHTEQADGN